MCFISVVPLWRLSSGKKVRTVSTLSSYLAYVLTSYLRVTSYQFSWTKRRLEARLDRSQSVFYFVPQENRLIRRPLWAWKNLGESIFHWQDGSLRAKNAQIGEETCQLSCGTCQNFFSFTVVAVGVTFLKVTLPLAEKSTKWISLAVVSYLSPPVFPTTIPHHCCSLPLHGRYWCKVNVILTKISVCVQADLVVNLGADKVTKEMRKVD